MAQQPITITQGTPPYSISITESAQGTAVTCTSGCGSSADTNRTLVFTELTGNHNYKIRLTDSSNPPCITEQITQSINCTKYPSFSVVGHNPVCTGSSLSNGTIDIINIQNATKYKVFTDNITADCSNAFATNGQTSITSGIFNPGPGTSTTFTVRLWNTTDSCDYYTDRQVTITSPVCSQSCTLSLTLGTPSC